MPQPQRKPFTARGIGALAVFLLAFTGCSDPTGDPVEVPQTEPPVEEPTSSVEPTPEPEHFWPLTGLSAENDEFGPVISVKIENSPAARPQGGLEHADIVWEELVEGGMTRFVAMFHSDLPETFGPIRSVRPMDAAIAGPAGGIFVFSGGLAEYQARVAATGLVLVAEDVGAVEFYRDPNRSADHQLFAYPDMVLPRGTDQDPPPNLFSYAQEDEEPSAVAQGSPASRVATSFPSSSPSWEWDDTDEVWQRLESGQPAVAESGARLEAVNVVVIRADIIDTGNRDSAGAMVPETVLTGTGEAIVFTGGRMLEGTWEKDGPTDVLRLTADGEEILLAPGNTWVELVPNQGGAVSAE